MTNTDWITFLETRAFLQKMTKPNEEMIPILHKRESYIEKLWEGLILIPRRSVASELRQPSYNFEPADYRRRLIKHASSHFLGLPVREFANLKCLGDRYFDSAQKVVAERRVSATPSEQETITTLHAEIIDGYCRHYRLVPLWIADSIRYSERLLREFDLSTRRVNRMESTFCCFQCFGVNHLRTRSRMRSFSWICGKRLLDPTAIARRSEI